MKGVCVFWVALFLTSCIFFKLMGETDYVVISLAIIGATVIVFSVGYVLLTKIRRTKQNE